MHNVDRLTDLGKYVFFCNIIPQCIVNKVNHLRMLLLSCNMKHKWLILLYHYIAIVIYYLHEPTSSDVQSVFDFSRRVTVILTRTHDCDFLFSLYILLHQMELWPSHPFQACSKIRYHIHSSSTRELPALFNWKYCLAWWRFQKLIELIFFLLWIPWLLSYHIFDIAHSYSIPLKQSGCTFGWSINEFNNIFSWGKVR